MSEFCQSIREIAERRQQDIELSKRSVLLYRNEEQKHFLFKASVMLIYAAIEGGVREMSSCLFGYINRQDKDVSALSEPYLCLAIASICKLGEAVINQQKQQKISSQILQVVMGKAKMPGAVDLKSNITPDRLNKICQSIDMEYFLTNEDEKNLNQLLRFRNNIAHGDQEMPIDTQRIEQFNETAKYILEKFAAGIIECHQSSKWLINNYYL